MLIIDDNGMVWEYSASRGRIGGCMYFTLLLVFRTILFIIVMKEKSEYMINSLKTWRSLPAGYMAHRWMPETGKQKLGKNKLYLTNPNPFWGLWIAAALGLVLCQALDFVILKSNGDLNGDEIE